MVTAGPYRAVRLVERSCGASIYLGDGHGREVLLYVREDGNLDPASFHTGLEALRKLPGDFPAAHVLDGGIGAGGVWVASERLTGRTWADAWAHRRTRPGPPAPLLPYLMLREVIELLEVLEVAHATGVVHGGLSPDGLLTRPEDGRTMIAHFGVSWLLRTPLVVRPRYRAPEHFGEPILLDARTDVYGVALLLYQLLAGVAPHDDADAATLRERAMSAPLSRSTAIPEPIAEIIERATAKRADARYPSVAALREALTQAVSRAPGADPTSSGTRAVNPPRSGDGVQPPESHPAITLRSKDLPGEAAPVLAPTPMSTSTTALPVEGSAAVRSAATAIDAGPPAPAPARGEDTEAEAVILVRHPAALPSPPLPEVGRGARRGARSAAVALSIVAVAAAALALLMGSLALVRTESRPALAARLPMHSIHLLQVPAPPAPVPSASSVSRPQVTALPPSRPLPAPATARGPVQGTSAVPAAGSVAPVAAPAVSPTSPPPEVLSPTPSGNPRKFSWEIDDPCALSWYRCAKEVGVGGGR